MPFGCAASRPRGILRADHRFEFEQQPKIFLRRERGGRIHQREHAAAHALLLLRYIQNFGAIVSKASAQIASARVVEPSVRG